MSITDRIAHSRDLAQRMSWFTRLLLRLFARRFNREVFAPIIHRAAERGVITSVQLHELLAEFDPTQQGAVGIVTERRLT